MRLELEQTTFDVHVSVLYTIHKGGWLCSLYFVLGRGGGDDDVPLRPFRAGQQRRHFFFWDGQHPYAALLSVRRRLRDRPSDNTGRAI